jgi:hypothetical protein
MKKKVDKTHNYFIHHFWPQWPQQTIYHYTILNLYCHAKSKFLDHVAFVPDCVEIHAPPVCWLRQITRNAYTSISLLLFYSYYLRGVLTHTANSKYGKLVPDPL